mmetsp:Transcript_28866/g.26192  ORF Transcript_28866/g.26192 Transcript_28866/m.26192 type:complete len:101 (-) Transcript_28866:1129-1431(-)
MKRLEELYPRLEPNNEKVRILKNPQFLFKSRLFLQFNIDIKKIKLREKLNKLLYKPEIYMRSQVPEKFYDILMIFNQIRKCYKIAEIVSSNLFPNTEHLI